MRLVTATMGLSEIIYLPLEKVRKFRVSDLVIILKNSAVNS